MVVFWTVFLIVLVAFLLFALFLEKLIFLNVFPTFLVKQPFFLYVRTTADNERTCGPPPFFWSLQQAQNIQAIDRPPAWAAQSMQLVQLHCFLRFSHCEKTLHENCIYICFIYVYTHIVINIKLSEMTAHCTHVMVVNTGRYSWRRRVDFQQRRLQIRRNLNKRFCDWKSNLPYTNFLFYRPSFFGSASCFWAQARSRLGSGYSFMLNGLYL